MEGTHGLVIHHFGPDCNILRRVLSLPTLTSLVSSRGFTFLSDLRHWFFVMFHTQSQQKPNVLLPTSCMMLTCPSCLHTGCSLSYNPTSSVDEYMSSGRTVSEHAGCFRFIIYWNLDFSAGFLLNVCSLLMAWPLNMTFTINILQPNFVLQL